MNPYRVELDWLDRFSGLVAVVALVSILVGAVAVRIDAPQSPVSASEALDRVNPYPPSESASEANVGGKTAPTPNDTLPTDPCLRCAAKALRGDYGPLEEWQRAGYAAALGGGARVITAWVTTYYPEEGFRRGDATASGIGVDERVVAANRLPRWSWVWHNRTGIRQVLDTGARRNDRVARRKGAVLWVDFWEPQRGRLFGDDNAGVMPIHVITPP